MKHDEILAEVYRRASIIKQRELKQRKIILSCLSVIAFLAVLLLISLRRNKGVD